MTIKWDFPSCSLWLVYDELQNDKISTVSIGLYVIDISMSWICPMFQQPLDDITLASGQNSLIASAVIYGIHISLPES